MQQPSTLSREVTAADTGMDIGRLQSFGPAIDQIDDCVLDSRGAVQALSVRIDMSYVEEVRYHATAELFSVVLTLAQQIERLEDGVPQADVDRVVSTWIARIEEVREVVRESLDSKFKAREAVSFPGGVAAIYEEVLNHVVETAGQLDTIVGQLAIREQAPLTRDLLTRCLANIDKEFEFLSETKWENSELVQQLETGVPALHARLDAFLEKVIATARESPDNLGLQQKTLRALVRLLNNSSKPNPALSRREVCLKMIEFGCTEDCLNALSAFPDEAAVSCCKVLSALATLVEGEAELIRLGLTAEVVEALRSYDAGLKSTIDLDLLLKAIDVDKAAVRASSRRPQETRDHPGDPVSAYNLYRSCLSSR